MIAMTIRALADARSSVNPSSSAKAASAASASGKDAAAGGTFFFPFSGMILSPVLSLSLS
jgi:hypothetical protein